jgi:hypothetical protein
MITFLVISTIPEHNGFLSVIPKRILINEYTVEDLEELKTKINVPLGGECIVVEKSLAITLKPYLAYDVVEEE